MAERREKEEGEEEVAVKKMKRNVRIYFYQRFTSRRNTEWRFRRSARNTLAYLDLGDSARRHNHDQ